LKKKKTFKNLILKNKQSEKQKKMFLEYFRVFRYSFVRLCFDSVLKT
jgi:hypothetical protein